MIRERKRVGVFVNGIFGVAQAFQLHYGIFSRSIASERALFKAMASELAFEQDTIPCIWRSLGLSVGKSLVEH